MKSIKHFSVQTLAIVVSMMVMIIAWQVILAKTTVAPVDGDECAFTVTVEIAFAFLDDESQKKADELIKTWTDGMNKIWNGENGEGQTFGECDCKVTFNFVVTKLDAGKDCRQAPTGNHCINVVNQPTNQRGNVADAHQVPPDGSTNGFGEWTTSASATDAAHEVGHLMGLGEGYHYEDTDGDGDNDHVNDNPQTNPDGNPASQGIMSQTWGNPVVLQEYVDEIMNDAGYSCPGICCCGNGKVDEGSPAYEGCDPKATPNGCEQDQTCDEKTCECKGGKQPECGDGEINGFEQCDQTASPTGCEEGEQCVNCTCYKPEELAPPPATTPVPPAAEPEEPVEQPTVDPTQGAGDEPEVEQPADEDEDKVCTPTCGLGETCVDGVCRCGTGSACAHNEVCAGGECQCGNDDACATPYYCDGTECVCDECEEEPEPVSVCGDDNCDDDETCSNCPEDCGECPPACGDGVCDPGVEDCYLCAADCGACGPICGDGVCEKEESCVVCEIDCGLCAPPCGDGLCDFPLEDEVSCPTDCY